MGRDDRLASLRRQARDELVRTAADAALNGAESLWLSLEILPGIPLPASMITSWDVWGGASGTDLDARLTAYRPDAELLETAMGRVARTRTEGPSRVDETKRALALEYVHPTPVESVLLTVNASAAVIAEGEPYTALFDAIVDSLRWGEGLQSR